MDNNSNTDAEDVRSSPSSAREPVAMAEPESRKPMIPLSPNSKQRLDRMRAFAALHQPFSQEELQAPRCGEEGEQRPVADP